ncbi:hypothetical protein H0H93_004974 [Arthromyces matolae]|nr:hypothetical protein H0H93_004974 [Arthromyces matolae]
MSIIDALPPSLNLPPHLSAHKYFLVCTLTVAAWDTLVLSPRSWRLLKTPGWPILKILYNFIRVFMPVEFTIVAVAFFDTKWSQSQCQKFYLFEPICTAFLLAAASVAHVIRINAIYDKNRSVLFGMGALLAIQVVVTAICCGFYRSVPLLEGQGCIAGPKHNWVGIYWVGPTLLYTASFVLALVRSLKSLDTKPLSLWKLMLRDGLNLYGAIFLVNLTNMIFWFAITPTGPDDTIKTIVTSIAAVLTASMTLRIILSVRGSLVHGGSFALSNTQTASSRTTHVISTSRTGGVTSNFSAAANPAHTYTLDDMRSKTEADWNTDKTSDTMNLGETKPAILDGEHEHEHGLQQRPNVGVKITIDRQVGYDDTYHGK